MAGLAWADAMAGVGARSESAGWTWKHQSKLAKAAGDTSSIWFLDWPAGSDPQWFHVLCDVARERRGALLAALKRMGDVCDIVDGRIAFQKDDFGGIVLDDDLGLPVTECVVIAEPPLKGKHRENPDAVYEAMHPRRELKPSSYSGHKPPEVAVPVYTGSALGDYIKASKPTTITKQPTPMREFFEAKLAEARANPNRPSARPRPVAVLGRYSDDPPERLSQPSNQTGLPTRADDPPRRQAPQPKPAPVDYSRRGAPVRIDAPGRG